MAHKESEELQSNERYSLDKYSFRIERSSGTSPNYDKIEAICTKDNKNARKSIQVDSRARLGGWYVEANSTTADVYAVLEVPIEGSGDEHISDLDISPATMPVGSGGPVTWNPGDDTNWYEIYSGLPMSLFVVGGSFVCIIASESEATWTETTIPKRSSAGEETTETHTVGLQYTYNGKTVHYTNISSTISEGGSITGAPIQYLSEYVANHGGIAWTMIYGTAIDPEYEEKTMLVGRFAIDLGDAGGVGPESDWGDPGDYDEDWEEGDPTKTLYVTVVGALSGRHNDPIEDPSYSYIPSDKNTVKGYGCGGDGGHGGGGGAGASTVVVYKFATNQADGKEIVALAKRHGYGSGGGKGGKGGDGCILVYY